jgi:hypothetical protein
VRFCVKFKNKNKNKNKNPFKLSKNIKKGGGKGEPWFPLKIEPQTT